MQVSEKIHHYIQTNTCMKIKFRSDQTLNKLESKMCKRITQRKHTNNFRLPA